MMMCGACDECGYSVWKWAKNQNERGVVRWQRKSSQWMKSVFFLKAAMGMPDADGHKSTMASCFCVRVNDGCECD